MIDSYALARPFLHRLPPETAHDLTLWLLSRRLVPGGCDPAAFPGLHCRTMGLSFPNPVGLAAGFDKDARAIRPLFGLGFGFVEVGTVTPRPQPGNPRPRLFRLSADRAVINRFGFNNGGHDAMVRRLERVRAQGPLPGPLGVNIGANKDSADRVADYVAGVRRFAGLADYLTVNISSPNTPGLRALQSREALQALLDAVLDARAGQTSQPPLLLKVAPDVTEADMDDIAAVALNARLDGLIVSNTTIARPVGLAAKQAGETGGLSGRPLFKPSTDVLTAFRRRLDDRVVLIGAGGVENGRTARTKLAAGASLIQLYSALVYQGPGLVRAILRALDQTAVTAVRGA